MGPRRAPRRVADALREASLGFYRVWHAALGARHGLFEALLARPRSAGRLARDLGLARAPVARWCEGAESLGLLERRDGGAFAVPARHAAALARPDDAAYMGHHFDYLARKSLTFGALDALLRDGEAEAPSLDETYAVATAWDHVAYFERVLPRERALVRRLREGARVLDLGAGRGAWTRAAAARFPASRFDAADPHAASLKAARIALRGVPNARVLDLRRRAPDAAAYDLVFLGEVLAAAPHVREPLGAAFLALRPGGVLHALEGLAPEPGAPARSWGERLVRAMALDFSLDGSRFPTKREALEGLRAAGFVAASARDLGGSLYALRARRPR
jgi:SAM-dependent methyltransferase